MSRFEVRPGQHRPNPLRAGVIVLALAAVVNYAGYTKSVPLLPDKRELVRADFASAAHARTGTLVRVFGVEVGEVTKVERAPSGRGARVTMRIDKGEGVDLRRDARGALWWRTMLGRNMYIELDPGSRSAPALGDAVIPTARTQSQVEFDEWLEPLDEDGRRGMRAMVTEFDRALARPSQPRAAIERLAPAMRELAPAIDAFSGERRGDLARLVAGTSRAMGALSRDEAALAGLITSADVAFGVTAAKRSDLGAMLRSAPPAMRETRRTMARLRATVSLLDPLARDFRPGARALEPSLRSARSAMRAATPVLRDAEPLLAALGPGVKRLRTASESGIALVGGLMPTLELFNGRITEWAASFDPETKRIRTYALLGPLFNALSSIASPLDGSSNLIRMETTSATTAGSPCASWFAAGQQADCKAIFDALTALLGATP